MKVLALLVLVVGLANCSGVGYVTSNVTSYNLMRTSNNSTLYNVTLTNDPYEYPVYIVDLWGDRYTIGYDYGVLVGDMIKQCYDAVFYNVFADSGIPPEVIPILEFAAELFLDWQWDSFLSKQVPADYIQELQGIEDGGKSIRIHGLSTLLTRVIVLSNLPSDLSDLRFILKDEFESWKQTSNEQMPSNQELIEMFGRAVERAPVGLQCSMFGVWGARTEKGELYSARNLDWLSNLGLDQWKTIQIWHPDGAYEHAAIGYVVVYGALAGMSAKGISVHEANLEVDIETFDGFPFILRLRYIMENAASIAEGWNLWETTNNTIGFNHMIASAVDAQGASSHAALAIETMAGYNAFFLDNDPREAAATYYDSTTQEDVPIGFPLVDALWRTNHGYDPVVRSHYMWKQMSAGTWSMERYMFAYEGFTYYQKNQILIGAEQAINITAILGDKGHHAYQCEDNTDGSNIISVTFHPIGQDFWAAWENSSGSSWRPACCNNYIHFDLSDFFTQTPDVN